MEYCAICKEPAKFHWEFTTYHLLLTSEPKELEANYCKIHYLNKINEMHVELAEWAEGFD